MPRPIVLRGLLLLALPCAAPARAEEPPRITFADVTEEAGLGAARGDRFSFGDFDDDGDPDLLVEGRMLWRNDTDPRARAAHSVRFTDVTEESGIGQGAGGGAVWADLDRDGDLDVVTTGGAVKIQGERGHFSDQARGRGLVLEKASASVGVGDVDGDGFPDVLFGGGEDWNDGDPVYQPRRLFQNVGGKTFEDVTAAHELGGGRYGRAVVFADHDGDGDLDVYLGNYRLQANELLVNEGGRLVNRAAAAGVAGRLTDDRGTHPQTGERYGYHHGHTIAASFADLDGDGDLDLWVSNLVHKFVGESPQFPGGFDMRGWICDDSAIYENLGAPTHAFVDRRADSGIAFKPTGGRGVFRGDELWSNAACADLDGDGLPEVLVTQVYDLPYSHSLLFRNRGGFAFEEVSAPAGLRRFNSYGAAFADVDGDGDLDVVLGGSGEPKGPGEVRLLRNDTPRTPWIGFRMRGPGKDSLPIGAEVRLDTRTGTLVRQVEGAMGSHAQQNEGVLRFGLAGREVVSAWARWPGGVLRRVRKAEPGKVHEVRHPEGTLPTLELPEPEPAEDGALVFRPKSRSAAGFALSFVLEGAGTLEASAKSGVARVRLAGPADLRVRLFRESDGVGREVVRHLTAP